LRLAINSNLEKNAKTRLTEQSAKNALSKNSILARRDSGGGKRNIVSFNFTHSNKNFCYL